ncbi:hypothetical protein LguiB_032020 [Lonicera macranthoides]
MFSLSVSLILVLLFLVFTFLLFITTKVIINPSYYSTANLPPGTFGWPVIGETLQLLRAAGSGKPEKFMQERVERHTCPQVFKTSLFGEKVAVLCGPAGNKFLFGNENKHVAVWWPSSMRKVFGECLLTSVGEEAKWMRKMLSSFLTPDAFTRLYITTMGEVTQQHIKTHWQDKEEVKVYETIKLYTFELACRLFMSLEDPLHMSKLAYQFTICLKGLIAIPLNIPGTQFYSAMRASTAINKELVGIIRQRKLALEQRTASPSQDLLSHLLVSSDENGRFLTEAEIVNNILVLLFAGHDTSTIAITFLMKILGELPLVYDKVLAGCDLFAMTILVDEQIDILRLMKLGTIEQMDIAVAKAKGELLQWEDIQKMKYSWNVVSEVLRLWPPVNGGFREALVDFTYAGYTIPKGWKLFWSPSLTQRDQNFFPNIENFDASRFEEAGPAPFSYVPFGGGPRMCLGKEFARMEILIFLHNVVKRFKWDLLVPDEKIAYFPVPNPVNGLPILLRPHEL